MGFAFVYFVQPEEAKESQMFPNGTDINRGRIIIKFPFTDLEREEPQTFSDFEFTYTIDTTLFNTKHVVGSKKSRRI